MHPFSAKKTYFHAYLITAALTFLTALLFSMVFTHVPLRTNILLVFSNLSLGLAVFSGAFYIARSTPFFRFTNIVVLSASVLITVICCSFFFGELDTGLFIQKTVLICAASFLGEISGRM